MYRPPISHSALQSCWFTAWTNNLTTCVAICGGDFAGSVVFAGSVEKDGPVVTVGPVAVVATGSVVTTGLVVKGVVGALVAPGASDGCDTGPVVIPAADWPPLFARKDTMTTAATAATSAMLSNTPTIAAVPKRGGGGGVGAEAPTRVRVSAGTAIGLRGSIWGPDPNADTRWAPSG